MYPTVKRKRAQRHDKQATSSAGALVQRAINGWLDLASQGDASMHAQLRAHVAAQRSELAREGESAVELLLIERVLTCTLEVEFFDLTRANSRGISLRQARFLEMRQAGADRRLATALRTLAAVRKLIR